MSRKAWIIFFAVQVVGEVCSWTGPRILSSRGLVLWVAGFLFLLPGKVLSALIVEKLSWSSALTVSQMTMLEVPLEGGQCCRVVAGLEAAEAPTRAVVFPCAHIQFR
jgi:hypothetical protein